jgi:putative PIN family toxin of toxin-antitoxin system
MLPLRLVLDTNIVVSSALKPNSLQRTVFLLAISKPARLYISQPILEEYSEILARPELRIVKGLRLQTLKLIKNRAHLVAPSRTLEITGDPDDNIFLECADAARADYLITGNQRHFPVFWKRTKIITSREFVGLTAPHLIP